MPGVFRGCARAGWQRPAEGASLRVFGDLWQNVTDGEYIDAPIVEDGNLISGKGLGHIFDFALTLAARLLGDDIPVRDHADHIYYRW